MQRRQFIFTSASSVLSASIAGFSTSALAQVTTPSIDVVSELKKLRITTGPYAGGYEIAPNGLLNWYFVNLGLLPIVQYLNQADLNTYILGYLDLYLGKMEKNYTIKDVTFPYGRARTDVFTLVGSDSDDSYAATLLSLAARYMTASGNWTWWNANKAKLKEIAYRNLAVMQKPTGLTSTFQPPRNATNSLGYLMDNCEVYRGLRDFASILRAGGEAVEANYYDTVATGIANGIATRMYDSVHGGFLASDGDTYATTEFYAGTTCQVFPQAFGVTELSAYYDKSWNYLNKHTPNWEDGRYDSYPWAVLGFVAAKRRDTGRAQAQMRTIESRFATNRAVITINELGFYQRAKSILAGRADI